uniref:Hyaluronidase n=1 Tax=Globodera rostochiensis TaxID=31243 RepID=A0A914GYK1_GLORO
MSPFFRLPPALFLPNTRFLIFLLGFWWLLIFQSVAIHPLEACSPVFPRNWPSITQIYWAVPSQTCVNRTDPPLDPTRFGIRTNAGQNFHGTEVVIFYESQLGLYPYIEYGGAGAEDNVGNVIVANKANLLKFINGGIPQNADLRQHLVKAREDILRAIPNPNFSGPAVIDYERWRPEYSLNWDQRRVYQRHSTLDALRRFPGISEKAATELGREIKFIVETIRLGRKLRPDALWGFYDTPLCNYNAGEGQPEERHCHEQFKKHNDKLWWLFGEVSALYSSVYLYDGDTKRRKGVCERHMQAKVSKAEWVNSLRRRDKPIVLFTKFELDPYSSAKTDSFYTKDDLFCTIDFTAQLGIDALIIWSTSQQMRERCSRLSAYVRDLFGPFVDGVLRRVNDPSLSSKFPVVPPDCAIPMAVVYCAIGADNACHGTVMSRGPGQSLHVFALRTIYTANIAITDNKQTMDFYR